MRLGDLRKGEEVPIHDQTNRSPATSAQMKAGRLPGIARPPSGTDAGGWRGGRVDAQSAGHRLRSRNDQRCSVTALTARFPHRRWPAAYRPLTLRLQAGLVLAEIVLFRAYGALDSAFHWGAHFLVAVTLSAVVLSAFLLVAGRPAAGQMLPILGPHLYAMFPDLLSRWGIPPATWMNVFAGHIAFTIGWVATGAGWTSPCWPFPHRIATD